MTKFYSIRVTELVYPGNSIYQNDLIRYGAEIIVITLLSINESRYNTFIGLIFYQMPRKPKRPPVATKRVPKNPTKTPPKKKTVKPPKEKSTKMIIIGSLDGSGLSAKKVASIMKIVNS